MFRRTVYAQGRVCRELYGSDQDVAQRGVLSVQDLTRHGHDLARLSQGFRDPEAFVGAIEVGPLQLEDLGQQQPPGPGAIAVGPARPLARVDGGVKQQRPPENQPHPDQRTPQEHHHPRPAAPQRTAPVHHPDVAQRARGQDGPHGEDVQVEHAGATPHQGHHVDRRRARVRQCADQRADDEPFSTPSEDGGDEGHVVEKPWKHPVIARDRVDAVDRRHVVVVVPRHYRR